jgi:hypothetical protein
VRSETDTKSDGQVHFFPVISNGKQLYDAMRASFPPSVNPKPDDWSFATALKCTKLGSSLLNRLPQSLQKAFENLRGLPLLD